MITKRHVPLFKLKYHPQELMVTITPLCITTRNHQIFDFECVFFIDWWPWWYALVIVHI